MRPSQLLKNGTCRPGETHASSKSGQFDHDRDRYPACRESYFNADGKAAFVGRVELQRDLGLVRVVLENPSPVKHWSVDSKIEIGEREGTL